ncbi:hypothetical protein BDF19DRAFT_173184 [Syncephalis fuscata]|nr:hypothetical protein BDF19DRAFT_173184 [Syncephalis fuscata]
MKRQVTLHGSPSQNDLHSDNSNSANSNNDCACSPTMHACIRQTDRQTSRYSCTHTHTMSSIKMDTYDLCYELRLFYCRFVVDYRRPSHVYCLLTDLFSLTHIQLLNFFVWTTCLLACLSVRQLSICYLPVVCLYVGCSATALCIVLLFRFHRLFSFDLCDDTAHHHTLFAPFYYCYTISLVTAICEFIPSVGRLNIFIIICYLVFAAILTSV